jgi:uncharacterized protein YecE (DUF72 family)
MWSHKAWPGRFLPQPLPAPERLAAYAEWCNAVEGNTTFYATPARDTVATWARQTSPDFRFVIKLPRSSRMSAGWWAPTRRCGRS